MNQIEPLISADKKLIEFNLTTFVLAVLLAIILTAANAYIGLLVGMTVSASIPAAALSMALMSWFKNSNILQNNMVQTSASAGEALAAGVIFTVPALVLMQAWQTYQFIPTLLLALSGGLLGVIFTIPLRHALIVEQQLKFPEGIATSEVLQAGVNSTGQTQLGVRHLLQACGLSALFKLLESGFGILSGSINLIKTGLSGSLLTQFSIQFSPALLGVGYIIGLNIAALVFIGGLIGTLIGIPVSWYFNQSHWLAELASTQPHLNSQLNISQLSFNELTQLSQMIWQDNRRIGVGAMLVGGIWSIIQIAKPVFYSIKLNIQSFKQYKTTGFSQLRTERDMPFPLLSLLIPLLILPLIYLIYPLLAQTHSPIFFTLIWTMLLIVFAFVFASVAGYMAGVVGSSNNPISGVTIATVLVSSLILFHLLAKQPHIAQLGPIIVMFLAAVTCSAAAIAGDNLQDLKCGHILGATPWKQQMFQMIGVVVAALVLPFILILLDTSYGIGRPAPDGHSNQYLAAPQAGLMQDLTTGIFNQTIDWFMIQIGAVLAVTIIIIDSLLARFKKQFRLHVLAIAIGIYLPFGLTVTLLIGGLLNYWIKHKTKKLTPDALDKQNKNGLLLASGLITGEALMGVVLALVAAFVMPLANAMEYAQWTGLITFFMVVLYIYKRTRSPV